MACNIIFVTLIYINLILNSYQYYLQKYFHLEQTHTVKILNLNKFYANFIDKKNY